MERNMIIKNLISGIEYIEGIKPTDSSDIELLNSYSKTYFEGKDAEMRLYLMSNYLEHSEIHYLSLSLFVREYSEEKYNMLTSIGYNLIGEEGVVMILTINVKPVNTLSEFVDFLLPFAEKMEKINK